MKLGTCLLAIVGIALVGGCGGSSPTAPTTPVVEDPIHLTANSTSINYGDTVQLSVNLDPGYRILESSISTSPSSFPVSDTPAVDTVYYVVATNDVKAAYSKLTVHVNKSAKRFWIVGDATGNEYKIANTWVKSVSDVAPSQSTSMPTDPAQYDAVIILPSATVTPSNQTQVTAALSANKGVMVIGDAAKKLSTGDVNNSNLTASSSWLGASVSYHWFTGNYEVGPVPGASKLITHSFGTAMNVDIVVFDMIAPASQNAARMQTPPIGGKVLYLSFMEHPGAIRNNGYALDYYAAAYLRWLAS